MRFIQLISQGISDCFIEICHVTISRSPQAMTINVDIVAGFEIRELFSGNQCVKLDDKAWRLWGIPMQECVKCSLK